MISTSRRTLLTAVATSALLLSCVALLLSSAASHSWEDEANELSAVHLRPYLPRPSPLGADDQDDEEDLRDPALKRLETDPWFTTTADDVLRQAAQEVARTRLEEIIIRRVEHLSYSQSGTLDQLTRVVEERVIYDKHLIHRLRKEVAMTISPTGPGVELPTVKALEEKLKAKMMAQLTREAVKEINALVAETHEPESVQQVAKDHLLERTTDLMLPQVEGRVRRFVLRRVDAASKVGVAIVLRYLARSVNAEEQRELLGGPVVAGVDYSAVGKEDSETNVKLGPNSAATAEQIAQHVLETTQGTQQEAKAAVAQVVRKLAASRKMSLGDAAAAAPAAAAPAAAAPVPAAQAAQAANQAAIAKGEEEEAAAAAAGGETATAEEDSSASSGEENEMIGDEPPGATVIDGGVVILIIAVLIVMLVVAHM